MYTSARKRMMKHIIETTYKLLEDSNFSEMTIQVICNEAEINRSTFYRYFEDKYDLLYYISQHIAQETYKYAQKHESETIFEALIYFVDSNKKVFRHMLMPDSSNGLFDELLIISKRLFMEQSQTIDSSLSYKIRKAKHPELLSDFYSSGLLAILKEWIESNYKYSTEELIEVLNDALL